jgi:hypothetical protein
MEDLNKMNQHFPDVCRELIEDATQKVVDHTFLKHETIRKCEVEKVKSQSDYQSNISSIFLSGMQRVMQDEEKDLEVLQKTGSKSRTKIPLKRSSFAVNKKLAVPPEGP